MNSISLLTKKESFSPENLFEKLEEITKKEESDKILFEISELLIPSSLGLLGYLISLENLAQKLGVFSRTLQNYLQGENSSYPKILQETRKSMCNTMIRRA